MTVFEYHKKAFLEMKDKPPKERLEYFWEYYKWYAIAVLLVILAVIYTVVAFTNRKEDVLFGTLMNSPNKEIETVTYLDDFYPMAGIDPEEEQIVISTDVVFSDSYYDSQSGLDPTQLLVAYVAAEQMDFVVGPDTVFEMCSYNTSRLLADLRDVVDAETLKQWEDRLYYIDKEVFEEVRTATIGTMPELPDPRNPEAMADPIPVAIDISDCTAFAESYYTEGQTLYLGIAINAPHLDTTLQFIDYVLNK